MQPERRRALFEVGLESSTAHDGRGRELKRYGRQAAGKECCAAGRDKSMTCSSLAARVGTRLCGDVSSIHPSLHPIGVLLFRLRASPKLPSSRVWGQDGA